MVSTACLLIGTIVGYILYPYSLSLMFIPFKSIESSIISETLFMTSLLEGFFTKLKFSFMSGLMLCSPILIYQFLRFVLPALEKVEKRLLILSVFVGALLASFGFYLCYFFLLPFSISFLTSSEFLPEQVGLMLNFGSNIFYVFNLLIYAILIFQSPIVLELMLYLNIVSRKRLLSLSRYVIVFIFVLSAVVTPPDIITQVGIALPLVILYFMTIGIAWIFKWGQDV